MIRTFDAESLENHQVVDALPDEEGARSLVGCGGTLMDQEILIVDPETRTRCPADGVGEIWVAGPSAGKAIGSGRRKRSTHSMPIWPMAAAPICAPAIWGSCAITSCSSTAGSRT